MILQYNKGITFTLAKIISIVFHPLFMPLYGLGIIFTAPTLLEYLPAEVKKVLVLIILVNNIIIPVTLLHLLRNRNLINSYNIEERGERVVPLILVSFLYSITSYMVFRYQIPVFLKAFILASTLLVISVTIINLWWKISIHAVAAGALVSVVIILSIKMYSPLTFYLVATILAGGLILSSRLKLNSHNPSQVWFGFFTGLSGLMLFISLI